MAQRPTLTTSAAAPLGGRTETPIAIGGISVPDSKLAREMAEFVKDTESPLLFHHSSRVYYWGALTGPRRGLHFDPELLYAGATSPAISCGAMASPSVASRRSGPRSRRTRHPAFRSSCIPSLRLLPPASRWTCLALRIPSSLRPSAKPSSTHTRAPALQGRDHPGLLRRHPSQTRDD